MTDALLSTPDDPASPGGQTTGSPKPGRAGFRTRTHEVLRAGLLGGMAAVLGFGLDLLLTAILGVRVLLMPLVIGIAVGWAVQIGANGCGGWVFQIMAVLMSYLAIVLGHLALIPAEVRDMLDLSLPSAMFVFSLPLLRGINGVFGLAMILLGLFQAWRWNRRPRSTVDERLCPDAQSDAPLLSKESTHHA